MDKKRSIWKNFVWALAYTPHTLFFSLIILTLVQAFADTITKIQSAGYWWYIFIVTVAYSLPLVYFIYEPVIRRNLKRRQAVNALTLYWKEQLEKHNKSQPSVSEIEYVRQLLLERIKIWAWFDPDFWIKEFPDEKYSEYLFGIVDNFIPYWEREKADWEQSKKCRK